MRMSEMTDAYVKLDKVSKIYGTKEVKIVAVDEISFEIAKGEFVVIVGPSGAGKTRSIYETHDPPEHLPGDKLSGRKRRFL